LVCLKGKEIKKSA